MPVDLETRSATREDTHIFAVDEQSNASLDNLGIGGSQLRASRHVSVREIEQRSARDRPDERPKSGVNEATHWEGRIPERLGLVQKGYKNLAIICTFLAGVQASLLGATFTQPGVTSEIVNAFFFAGLVADIGAAILSAASQRWFEMIRQDEAEHVYDYMIARRSDEEAQIELVQEDRKSWYSQTGTKVVMEKERQETVRASSPSVVTSKPYYIIESWLRVALKAPPFAAVIGFGFMISGVMLWVWSHGSIEAKVICTVLCAWLVMLLPPFVIPHDRKETLRLFKLKRVSG